MPRRQSAPRRKLRQHRSPVLHRATARKRSARCPMRRRLCGASGCRASTPDGGGIYVSAYRSESLGVRRGPCRVIRLDPETGGPTGYVDVPSPCGHAGGLAVGGDGMLYVADTHTLFATPLAQAFEPGARFRQFPLGPGVIGGLAASTPDGIWLGTYENGPAPAFPLHGGDPG